MNWMVGIFLGKGGRELFASAANGRQWAVAPQPCAVIAGTRSLTWLNPIGWVSNGFRIISKPNDGTIAVDETRLEDKWMKEFHLVPAGHTQIQNHEQVMTITSDFIRAQNFDSCDNIRKSLP